MIPARDPARRAAGLLALALLAPLAAACVPAEDRAEPVEYGAVTLAGDSVSLTALRGEPVLLNVWATWCPPCREEIPELQELHERYAPRGLQVLGVSIDAAGARDRIRAFVDEMGVGYRIWHDAGNRISSVLRARGVPTTVLIGPEGRVRWRHLGPVTASDTTLLHAIDRALARSS